MELVEYSKTSLHTRSGCEAGANKGRRHEANKQTCSEFVLTSSTVLGIHVMRKAIYSNRVFFQTEERVFQGLMLETQLRILF